MNRLVFIGAALLPALLAACGGNTSDPVVDTPPPVAAHEVPASASASTQVFTAYAATLVASDTAEPLDLGPLVPPTSETEEPRAL
jgi:hypothetical protein